MHGLVSDLVWFLQEALLNLTISSTCRILVPPTFSKQALHPGNYLADLVITLIAVEGPILLDDLTQANATARDPVPAENLSSGFHALDDSLASISEPARAFLSGDPSLLGLYETASVFTPVSGQDAAFVNEKLATMTGCSEGLLLPRLFQNAEGMESFKDVLR